MITEQTTAPEPIKKMPSITGRLRRIAFTALAGFLVACGPTAPVQEPTPGPAKGGEMYNADPDQCNYLFSSATLEQRGCAPEVIRAAQQYEKGQIDIVATATANQP